MSAPLRETRHRSALVARRARRARVCAGCTAEIRPGSVYVFHTLFPRNDILDNTAPVVSDECGDCARRYGRGHLIEAREASPNGGRKSKVEINSRCSESEVGIPQKILDRLVVNDCWEWVAGKNAGGYGCIYLAGKRWLAHRLMWETLVGQIPDDQQIDHLCRNRACCNPDHLEPVTQQVNIARGAKVKKRPECPEGHTYDVFIERRGGVERRCSRCETAKRRIRTERDRLRRVEARQGAGA